jgi:hypothetical protein
MSKEDIMNHRLALSKLGGKVAGRSDIPLP